MKLAPSIDDDSVGMWPEPGAPVRFMFPLRSSDFSSSRRRKQAALGFRLRSRVTVAALRRRTSLLIAGTYRELAAQAL